MNSGVGYRIRKYRLTAGKTLQQLADACGCTKAYLSQVERFDHNGRLRAELALGIAKTLDVPLATLMEEEANPALTIEDLSFFRQYCALSGPEKIRFQQVCQLMKG